MKNNDGAGFRIFMVSVFCSAFVFSVYDMGRNVNLKRKHNSFKPIKHLSTTEDSLVYSVGDSVLDARKARYDELVADYNYAFKEMSKMTDNCLVFHKRFDKHFVYPKFSEQIGAKNIVQYSKYLSRYERDSLVPVYRDVYRDKVIPKIRDNTQSR